MARSSKATVIGLLAIAGVLTVGSAVAYFSFTKNPTQGLPQQALLPQFRNDSQLGTQTFTVKRIAVEYEGSCETLDIKINGEAKQVECDDTYIENRKLLSNETIEKLFGSLTKESFLALEDKYYAPNLSLSLQLTIETNFGTKTITISNTDNTAPEITEELEDIVEEIEEVEEEINQPDPSPPPSIPPTPIPTLSPGATPTPAGSPTPTPISTPTPEPGATPEPFRCDMLDQQDVTVSNIRCLEDEDF